MTTKTSKGATAPQHGEPIEVAELHLPHPQIRAEDWRSPLVKRLLGSDEYHDGEQAMKDSFRAQKASVVENTLMLSWHGLSEDFAKCCKTYQDPVITEFATLGLACILVARRAGLEITEVTRRGEKADYWLGNKEALLEVSGQEEGNLETLCEAKAVQLKANPFGKSGFVCVAIYGDACCRLWFYTYDKS
jgi:hypothetical protein